MEMWDVVLLLVAGYVATSGLASLMTRRRDQLIEQFREQMEQGAEPAASARSSGASSGQTG